MRLSIGSTGDVVSSVQKILTELGYYPDEIDGKFGMKMEKAVIRFQESVGIFADGVVGPVTMERLERAYAVHAMEMMSPGVGSVDAEEGRLIYVRCPADKYGTGYDRVFLRQDAADAYKRVYDRVHALGGILTSSGGRRDLDAEVSYNRSALSMHYIGLALDLFVWSALVDPETDPYVVRLKNPYEKAFESSASRQLEVFVRCSSVHPGVVEIDNVLVKNNPKLTIRKKVQGPFVNLTQLFAEEGFVPVPFRRRFLDNGDAMASEWWHFQYEKALIPRISTFGGELLKVYPKRRLEGTPPWNHRDAIFKVNWA